MDNATPSSGMAEDELTIGGDNVSRSGRVRKKSSLLAGFESMDQLEKGKRKPEKRSRESTTPKVTLHVEDGQGPPPKKSVKRAPLVNKRMKVTGVQKARKANSQKPKISASTTSKHHLDLGGDLEMDLPPDFETNMRNLTAEEVIDYSSSDVDERFDGGRNHQNTINNIKLKSQAQSTYMMEKTVDKNKKTTGGPQVNAGTKAKAVRKNKGNPRITGYTLWVKDQRPVLEKKYTNFDHSSLSKKLSEVWSQVPTNQKKMWKNKAAKMMRKNSNVMENIKNSGPLPSKGRKQRGRPRVNANDNTDSNGMENGAKKGPTPKMIRKPNNFLNQSEKRAPSKTVWKPQPPVKSVQSMKPGSSNGNTASTSVKSIKFKQLSPMDSKLNLKHNIFASTPTTSYSFSNSKSISPRKDEDGSMYKVTGTAPMDVAAHFSLLGESLSIIGERLKDVEGQTVSGSLSVLLDSLLCATGPLLCLSQQVPELNCIPQEKLTHLLDNIAYVMPGL